MLAFGFITEGPTDEEVIENILTGYFENPDLLFNPLQPKRDETDKSRFIPPAGWNQVFEYCSSEDFKKSFQFNDYIIIQIDTDISEDCGIPKIVNGKELRPDELINRFIGKFINKIGEDFYNANQNKIIFAISVHSIECWLLPLYYENEKSKREKTKNCLDTLNQKLRSQEKFTIDSKDLDYYRKISRAFLKMKKKQLIKSCSYNPSLKIFIEKLSEKSIIINNEQ